jgi:integration host factor alpha subunit
MTKTEMEHQLAQSLGLPKERARELLNLVLDQLILALSRGERVTLIGFGTFEVRENASRSGRNPTTGEAIHIHASRRVLFRPGMKLKNRVQTPPHSQHNEDDPQ